MYLDHSITQKANWRKTWLQPLKEAPILPGDRSSQGSMRSFYCLHTLFVCTPEATIIGLENFLGDHWLLLVTFGLLKGPKEGVGQCAQSGILVVHLWFLHRWGIGLEATCRSPREKWQCWDLPLILKGRVTVTYTWGRHSCSRCHQCRDLRESTIWADFLFSQHLIVEHFPDPHSGILELGQRNAKDSMANTFGKCSILDPFPEFHSAHGPLGSLLKRKPVLPHLTHCAPQIHLTLDLIFSWILINIPWNSVLKGWGFRRQLLRGDTNCW